MAHFTPVRGSWIGVTVLSPTDLARFDADHVKAINGDDGGAWAPNVAIEIGGAGVDLQGANHKVSGRLSVPGLGASIDVNTGGVVRLGVGSFLQLDGGTVVSTAIVSRVQRLGPPTDKLYFFDNNVDQGFIQSNNSGALAHMVLDPYLIRNAVLTQVEIGITVAGSHVGLPGQTIAAQINAHGPGLTNTVVDGSGIIHCPGGSTGAYEATTSFVMNLAGAPAPLGGPFGLNIDRDNYSYVLSIEDEQGVNALVGAKIWSVTLTQSLIDNPFAP